MIWSRHWVSTCTVTSSGMRCCSMSARRNSYSVSLAAGNPTSISLKPSLTRKRKKSSFSSRLMGTIRLWLPSRRSTLHQMGGFSMWSFFAQRISHRGAGKYPGLYLSACIMVPFSFSCSVLGDGHGNEKSSVSWPFGPRDGALKISFAVPLLLPGNTRPLRAISLQNRRTA